MDRRNFLRFLGLGAAAAVAAPIIKPKAFFSFFGTGEVWKPAFTAEPWQLKFLTASTPRRPNIWYMNRRTYDMLMAQQIERMVNPPLIMDEASYT
jgi:hypothetical protein